MPDIGNSTVFLARSIQDLVGYVDGLHRISSAGQYSTVQYYATMEIAQDQRVRHTTVRGTNDHCATESRGHGMSTSADPGLKETQYKMFGFPVFT